MIKHYICKEDLIETLNDMHKINPETLLSTAISIVNNVEHERVVPQYMYRLAEYDKNKLLNELQYFETTHNIMRCKKCKYSELKGNRFYCEKFRLFDGQKNEIPSNGYCSWAEPKEE